MCVVVSKDHGGSGLPIVGLRALGLGLGFIQVVSREIRNGMIDAYGDPFLYSL